MGGTIIETEADRIYERGIAIGTKQGKEQGIEQGIDIGSSSLAEAVYLVRDGCNTVEALSLKGISEKIAKLALQLG